MPVAVHVVQYIGHSHQVKVMSVSLYPVYRASTVYFIAAVSSF